MPCHALFAGLRLFFLVTQSYAQAEPPVLTTGIVLDVSAPLHAPELLEIIKLTDITVFLGLSDTKYKRAPDWKLGARLPCRGLNIVFNHLFITLVGVCLISVPLFPNRGDFVIISTSTHGAALHTEQRVTPDKAIRTLCLAVS